MSKHCDDSISYEESRGEKNYFAVKKVYEGSFDGETWYRAGILCTMEMAKRECLSQKFLLWNMTEVFLLRMKKVSLHVVLKK